MAYDVPSPEAEPSAETTDSVIGVGELTRTIKLTLEQRFDTVWVEGELLNLKRHGSGHWYFALKDGQAQLSGVMFRSAARRVRFAAADGLRVQCQGRITVYEPRGQYQIVVEKMRPAGVGVLLQALEELKRKLAAEGLFENSRKRPIPHLPRRVGLVTSPTGAAIRDMLRILHDRFPVPVLLYPAAVQGVAAVPSIVDGIHALDAVDDVDVIIVGRGGGSLEDLWAFNEEPVARAIAECITPTVSAVGHEVDNLLSDLVADRRAPTPTGAAEMVVPDYDDLDAILTELTSRLGRAMRRRIQEGRLALEYRHGRIPHPRRSLEQRAQRLDEATRRMHTAMASRVREARRDLQLADQRLRTNHPARHSRVHRQTLAALQDRLRSGIRQQFVQARHRLERLDGQLRALGPQEVLDRGYSIVRHAESGAVIRAATDARRGVPLRITSADGEYLATAGRPGKTPSPRRSKKPQTAVGQGDLFGSDPTTEPAE